MTDELFTPSTTHDLGLFERFRSLMWAAEHAKAVTLRRGMLGPFTGQRYAAGSYLTIFARAEARKLGELLILSARRHGVPLNPWVIDRTAILVDYFAIREGSFMQGVVYKSRSLSYGEVHELIRRLGSLFWCAEYAQAVTLKADLQGPISNELYEAGSYLTVFARNEGLHLGNFLLEEHKQNGIMLPNWIQDATTILDDFFAMRGGSFLQDLGQPKQ